VGRGGVTGRLFRNCGNQLFDEFHPEFRRFVRLDRYRRQTDHAATILSGGSCFFNTLFLLFPALFIFTSGYSGQHIQKHIIDGFKHTRIKLVLYW